MCIVRIFQREGSERVKAQTDPKEQLLEKTESKYVNVTLYQPLKMGCWEGLGARGEGDDRE